MQLSKRPIVLYDGILKQLQDGDNIGRYVFTVVSKDPDNDGDELQPFTQVHANTSGQSFNLKLPSNPEEGDTIKIIDIKSVFSQKSLVIEPNGNSIEGGTNNVELDVAGTIATFVYTDSDSGWILDVTGKSLNMLDDFNEYNIEPSTAEMGSRKGLFVYQTGNANKVGLASAHDIDKVPALGIIHEDNDVKVQVRSRAGAIVDVKIDNESIEDMEPGKHVFLSGTEDGKVAYDPDAEDVAVYQIVGTCNTGPSEGYIKLNLWVNPEIYA